MQRCHRNMLLFSEVFRVSGRGTKGHLHRRNSGLKITNKISHIINSVAVIYEVKREGMIFFVSECSKHHSESTIRWHLLPKGTLAWLALKKYDIDGVQIKTSKIRIRTMNWKEAQLRQIGEIVTTIVNNTKAAPKGEREPIMVSD